MDQKPEPPEKNDKSAFALLWLMVGLVPIAILLSFPSTNGGPPFTHPGLILILCGICNVVGGIGCVSGVKDPGTRLTLGLLLAGFFFVLSWGVALFQACSHMSI